MPIRVLSDSAINKIAAGEVVERPLAVVKELIENSIDAGATSISIVFARGGRTLISVSDNGIGIGKEDLLLAIKRHATSKLNEDDLDSICFLGFRGEALPSIAAVSKMKIISYIKEGTSAWELSAGGGAEVELKPCTRNVGTTVEVRDLFCFTPSRLKFLKSEVSENSACVDLVTRFALSLPETEFKLTINDKMVLHIADCGDPVNDIRTGKLLGESFVENTVPLQVESNGIRLRGRVSLPTFHNATSSKQYFYVNNRIVKDKLLIGSIRAAYANIMPSGRYPIGIIFVDVDSTEVDVNVHPTKAEVRFRDEQKIRYSIINAIRNSLADGPLNQSTTVTNKALSYVQQNMSQGASLSLKKPAAKKISTSSFRTNFTKEEDKLAEKIYKPDGFDINRLKKSTASSLTKGEAHLPISSEIPKIGGEKLLIEDKVLGMAKCQIDKTYIISQADDGMVIVDQHAAHERLVLERLKEQIKGRGIAMQYLLIPEIIELGQSDVIKILEKSQELKKLGIIIERNGVNQVLISAIPAVFGEIDVQTLIRDISANLSSFDHLDVLEESIEEIYGNIACKNSIQAGRILNIEEMDALLRDMEKTPFSGQCNHGRPTYVKLTINDLEKIFERK